MKMIMIVYNHSVDQEVMDLLKDCGIEHYTHFARATGVGGQGPHMGTNIWPSINNVTYIVVPTEVIAKRVLAAIKTLKIRFKEEGIQAWTWKIDAEA